MEKIDKPNDFVKVVHLDSFFACCLFSHFRKECFFSLKKNHDTSLKFEL